MIYSFETQRTKKQALICSPLRQTVGQGKVPDPLHETLFAHHSCNSSSPSNVIPNLGFKLSSHSGIKNEHFNI